MNLPDFLTEDPLGYIHLTGHRIGLRHIVQLYRDEYTPEMLHSHYPTIPLALIHKVIAFCLEHQSEVDDYVQVGQNTIQQLAAAPQPGPTASELRQRMECKKQRESA